MPIVYFVSRDSQGLLSFDFWKVGSRLRITEAKRFALGLAEQINRDVEVGAHVS